MNGSGKETVAERVSYTTNHPSDSYTAESSFNKLWERIRKSPERGTNTRRISWRSYAAAAASIAVLLIASFWLINNPTQSPNVLTLSVENGRQQYTLPDGTLIWLNSNSQLTYNDGFGIKTREVELNGEAYFEVVKDSGRPFVVKSHEMNVRVLGTSFNVKSYGKDAVFAATLVEGSVFVSKDQEGILETTLQPGQQLLYYKNSGRVTVQDVDIDQFTAWKDGRIIFKNDPILEAFAELENEFHVVIMVKNEQLQKRKVNGRFDLNENIEDILDVMQETLHFNFHWQNDTIIIK